MSAKNFYDVLRKKIYVVRQDGYLKITHTDEIGTSKIYECFEKAENQFLDEKLHYHLNEDGDGMGLVKQHEGWCEVLILRLVFKDGQHVQEVLDTRNNYTEMSEDFGLLRMHHYDY